MIAEGKGHRLYHRRPVDQRSAGGTQVFDPEAAVRNIDTCMTARHPGVGEDDVHHRSATNRGLGATESEAGSVVLSGDDLKDVVRGHRPGCGYSVEMFGSACWVTGLMVMKCSDGAASSGSRRRASSACPEALRALP